RRILPRWPRVSLSPRERVGVRGKERHKENDAGRNNDRARSYWAFVLTGAVVIVAAALIFWPRAGARLPLSLTVVGPGGMHSTEDLHVAFARIAITNNTKEAIVLGHLCVVGQTKSGWKRQDDFPIRFTSKVLPGQGFEFGTFIPTNAPCKVGV